MQVRARGYVIGVQLQDNGTVRGGFVQGDQSDGFYVKSGDVAKALAKQAGSQPLQVDVVGQVRPGRRYDTKEPDGTLSFEVQSFEPVQNAAGSR